MCSLSRHEKSGVVRPLIGPDGSGWKRSPFQIQRASEADFATSISASGATYSKSSATSGVETEPVLGPVSKVYPPC